MDTGKSKWIEKIQGQTDKLSHLVNDLVTLSRLDEEKPPIQINDFDLSAAVSEVAESFRDYAASHGHALELTIEKNFCYRGDEGAIRQLASILLDNAVKYTDPGGTIRLELKREKKKMILITENPCAAFDKAETDKLFDRFYRVDKSRSAKTGGFGVGLSIAKSIVEAHGGKIEAEFFDNGIIRFRAWLS